MSGEMVPRRRFRWCSGEDGVELDKRLVTREVFAADGRRRRRRITLTAARVTLADELIATHLANEQRLLSSLTDDQVSDLARLLAILAENLEAGHT